jgi:endonuclease-3 related protein
MSLSPVTTIYDNLFEHFGPQNWWPGETPDEILTGCVLAQNTRWERVVPVIENLKNLDLLSPGRLIDVPREKLAALLRGSGTHNRKAEYLLELARFFHGKGWDGRPESLADLDTYHLRNDLLELRGVGPETTDCILLYVLGRPVFVIDAYTRRILGRHGICTGSESYDELQSLFHESLSPDPELFNEYHALLVVCAKKYCRSAPVCDSCPLSCLKM